MATQILTNSSSLPFAHASFNNRNEGNIIRIQFLYGPTSSSDLLKARTRNFSIRCTGEPIQTLRTCKNCKTQFDVSLNHPRACRYHTAHFGGRCGDIIGAHQSLFGIYYETEVIVAVGLKWSRGGFQLCVVEVEVEVIYIYIYNMCTLSRCIDTH
ncbi:hypothetical protein LguiB_019265 [Lonicera macranthoides]